MDSKTALFVSLAVLFLFWYLSPSIFDYGIGFTLPIIGFIGITPFSGLSPYSMLFGGSLAVFTYFMLMRRKQK